MPHSRHNPDKKLYNSNNNPSKPNTSVTQPHSSFFSSASFGQTASNVVKEAKSAGSSIAATIIMTILVSSFCGSSTALSDGANENALLNANVHASNVRTTLDIGVIEGGGGGSGGGCPANLNLTECLAILFGPAAAVVFIIAVAATIACCWKFPNRDSSTTSESAEDRAVRNYNTLTL